MASLRSLASTLALLLAACAHHQRILPAKGNAGAPRDDTPVLQAALDAAGAAGGGTVELAPGLYTFRRALRVPSRVTLRGAGSARTTLRLVALETPPLASDPRCPDNPPRITPAAALYNGANGLLRQRRPYYPSSGRCGDAIADAAPPDRDLVLAGFTLDCNARTLWPGFQSAGSGNSGCIELDDLIGLRLDDVVVRDAAMDGIELGWSDGVVDFAIAGSRVEGSQRFGIGWIAAARGTIERTVLDGNLAGGVDLEPIGRFSLDEGVAHDVTLRDVRVVGMRGRPHPPTGRDYGVILSFSTVGRSRAIHLDGVHIEGVRGFGVALGWGGDYDDIELRLDVRGAELGGVGSRLTGRGTAHVEGRFSDVAWGPGVLGTPVGLSGREEGWRIGPLDIDLPPRWGNATVIAVPDGARGHRVEGVTARLSCNPADGGCRGSVLVGSASGRTPLDPSVSIARSRLETAR